MVIPVSYDAVNVTHHLNTHEHVLIDIGGHGSLDVRSQGQGNVVMQTSCMTASPHKESVIVRFCCLRRVCPGWWECISDIVIFVVIVDYET